MNAPGGFEGGSPKIDLILYLPKAPIALIK